MKKAGIKRLPYTIKHDLIYAGRCHLSVVRWLVERQNIGVKYESLVRYAAGDGAYDVVEYLHERGASVEEHVLEKVARRGDIDVMLWLVENGARLDARATKYAAKGGQVKALQWLLGRGCELSPEAIYSAIEHDHVEMVKYMDTNNHVVLTTTHLTLAAECGSTAVLDWFVKTFSGDGFDWDLLAHRAGILIPKDHDRYRAVNEWILANRPKK
jgi:hypothetical protein